MNNVQSRPPLPTLQQCFPERVVPVAEGTVVAIRECGRGPAVVLLHGIGSGSASWLHCAQSLAAAFRVIAWDAPGYGQSTVLPQAQPKASDYAQRLELLLQTLEVESCLLVGHSLGAMMAMAYATGVGTPRVRHLMLLSPAGGYGAAARREQGLRVRQQRLDDLERLGVSGIANERSVRLLGRAPDENAYAWVHWNMSRLKPQGYRQAIELLCGDELLRYGVPPMSCEVHCGEEDVVTPAQGCAVLAEQLGAPFSLIYGAGHASPIEKPEVVAARIADAQRHTV